MKSVIFGLAVPLLAQQDVNSYSLEKERALGTQYASEIRRQSKPLGDPAVQAYAERVAAKLLSGVTNGSLQYQFEVISDGDRTEPFALPGGYIFIPARIFMTARDEHEFAGTVAHAIGHAALRHGTRTATRGQIANMASIPLVFMGGWVAAHADSHHSQALVPVSFLEFQRKYELEADRFAVELCARTGYDPAAFLRYVQRTHPADSKYSPLPDRGVRIAALQDLIATLPASPRSPSDDFKRTEERVRSIVQRPREYRAPTLRR